ncbi:MAG: flagellar basal body rod protein FlgB [Candidatus Korobacteraceae bacterium]|jgi:flagellar basal-body rod protein FlgB
MSSLSTPLIDLLGHALDLTAQRQSLVSQNIANIDTPGYHARDINFRQELQQALSLDQTREDQANQMNQPDQEVAGPTPFVREVPGLIDRPDGNNVNIDQEASSLLLYQQAYQASAQVITTINQMLETVLNMGAGS